MVLSGGMEGLSALSSNKGGIAVSVTTPIGPWAYVYGTQKVGGVEIFRESNNNTGGGGSTSNNKQLHRVYALACHPCHIGSFQLRIDGKVVEVSPNGSGYSSVSPTQLTPSIVSISRTNGLVTMKLSSGLPNADGTTIFTKNVADPTFNCVAIISQPNPADNTTFTYVNGGPDTSSSGGICSTTYADYKDKIYVEFKNGNHTSTFTTLLNAGTNWGPTDLCLGRTLVYVQMGYDQGVFPSSIPNVSFVIDGKSDILDPRTGTRGFTENAALCIADFMSLPVTQGGFGLMIGTDIPTAQLIAAANICDEAVSLAGGGTIPRYTCNTYVPLNQGRGTILQSLLTSCAGRLSYQGGTFNVFPGAWVAPTLQLSDADLIGSFQFKRMSIRDLANGIKGTYVSPENDYQQADIPPYMQDVEHGYSSDQFLIEDRNERIFQDVNLPCTDNSATAQRLEKIALMRTRYQLRGTIRCSLRAYQAVALDVIQLSHPRYSWVNKYFEVLESRFVIDKSDGVPTLAVELDLAETDSSIFDWNTSEQLTPQGYSQSDNRSGVNTVSPPEQLTLYSGPGATIGGVTYPNTVSVGADGIKRNSLYVLWLPPNDAFVTQGGQIEVQYQLDGTPDWTTAGKFHGATNNCYINNVSDGLTYNVQIRSINVAGYTSEWVMAGPETLSSVTSSISVAAISGLSLGVIAGTLAASKVTGLASVATTGTIAASAITSGTLPTAALPAVLAQLNAGGTSGATVATGSTAQVGAGATATAIGSGLSGRITLTTGTGSLTGGTICTLTFPTTFTAAPNGVVAVNGAAILDLEWSTSTTALTLSVTAALAPSTTYTIGYSLS
jgi:hypothetical protein